MDDSNVCDVVKSDVLSLEIRSETNACVSHSVLSAHSVVIIASVERTVGTRIG